MENYEEKSNNIKKFIELRPGINRSTLAMNISYDKGSFHQWFTGKYGRKLPQEKLEQLEMVVESYGYNPEIEY